MPAPTNAPAVPEHGIYFFEIVAEDAEATRDFYADNFGYVFGDAVPEFGGSFVADLPEGSMISIRGSMHEMETPIVRIYLRVSDVHAATAKAEAGGAMILLPPTEIPGRGQFAIYQQSGIQQGIWQTP
ncbi:MAG: VOC family protein [Planctomycetota bacterium]